MKAQSSHDNAMTANVGIAKAHSSHDNAMTANVGIAPNMQQILC
jgi:hypothetical protein